MPSHCPKRRLLLPALLASFALLPAQTACAAAGDDDPSAVTVNASYGYSVYKSALVQSNDTGSTLDYGIALWAGSSRSLGMALERETSTLTFPLNGSSIAVAWQDVAVRYRLGPVYAGVLLSSSTWTVRAPPEDATGKIDATQTAVGLIDVNTTGYGGVLGAQFPVAKRAAITTEVNYVTSPNVMQRAIDPAAGTSAGTLHKSSIGPRLDFQIGGAIGLTKSLLDATCGFHYRTYHLTVDGTTSAEQLNSTFIGLQANWNL